MKKRILTTMFALSLALTACSSPLVNNDSQKETEEQSDDSSTEKNDTSSNENKEGKSSDISASSATVSEDENSESASDNEEKSTTPLYRLVSNDDTAIYYDDLYNSEVAGQYHVESLILMEECKDDYKELYNALHQIAEEKLEVFNSEHSEFHDFALSEYEAQLNEGKNPYKSYVTSQIYLKRTSDKYLSYYDNIEYRWEETRPYQKIGHTFDITTGKEVDLGDVLNITEDELNDIIANKLREDKPDESDALENVEDALSKYHYGLSKTGDDDMIYDWYFSVDGVHLVFNAYDIVDDFSFGSCEVVIAYDEDCINSEYVYNTDGGYSYMRTDMSLMSEDYYSGGSVSTPLLMYSLDDSDEEYADSLIVVNGDETASIDDVYWEVDDSYKVYDIVTSDNREYIYVTIEGIAQEWNLFVFDITDGGVTACGHKSYIMANLGYTKDPDFAGDPCFTDPDKLMIPVFTDIFGSIISYSYDIIGDDGMPEHVLDYYNISWASSEIRATKDIDVYKVSDDQTVDDTPTTLSEGTIVFPVRTDNETYIDCQLEDKSIVRIYVEYKDNSGYIDGTNVTELFDGLIFAN